MADVSDGIKIDGVGFRVGDKYWVEM